MVLPAVRTQEPKVAPLIAPTEEAWRAMTPEERQRLVLTVLDVLSDPRSLLSEGRAHKKAKSQAIDTLGLHFGRTGRAIYLAEEMAVLYPGKEVFSPDVLAVASVVQPADDQRMAWVVADEGRGLDFVLEVLHHGDRQKDLVANVERYAQLGIPEYFVYDRMRQQVLGYRLPDPSAARYQRILPQHCRHPSAVLGLDLMVSGGALRFYYGMAELFGSAGLIGRLEGVVGDLEARADQAQAQADEAQAERAQAQAERAQAQAEQAQAERAQALQGLRDGIVALLHARRSPISDDMRARLMACHEPAVLQGWLMRATTATSADEVFAG
jgi:Uma2 family endonuclease